MDWTPELLRLAGAVQAVYAWAARQSDCEKCVARLASMRLLGRHSETFIYDTTDGECWAWDIVKTHELLAGRPPVGLTRRELENLACGIEVNRNHLTHIPAGTPLQGVAVPFRGDLILIDGNHRAVKAALERRLFLVHILTPAESEAVTVGRPPQTHEDIAEKITLTHAREILTTHELAGDLR